MSMFPLKFEVSAEAKPGISTTWKSQTKGLEPITVAIPPELHGPGGRIFSRRFVWYGCIKLPNSSL